jgi:hypothetical protein
MYFFDNSILKKRLITTNNKSDVRNYCAKESTVTSKLQHLTLLQWGEGPDECRNKLEHVTLLQRLREY